MPAAVNTRAGALNRRALEECLADYTPFVLRPLGGPLLDAWRPDVAIDECSSGSMQRAEAAQRRIGLRHARRGPAVVKRLTGAGHELPRVICGA